MMPRTTKTNPITMTGRIFRPSLRPFGSLVAFQNAFDLCALDGLGKLKRDFALPRLAFAANAILQKQGGQGAGIFFPGHNDESFRCFLDFQVGLFFFSGQSHKWLLVRLGSSPVMLPSSWPF